MTVFVFIINLGIIITNVKNNDISIKSPITNNIYHVEGSNVNDWISKEINRKSVIIDNIGNPPIINENNNNLSWALLSNIKNDSMLFEVPTSYANNVWKFIISLAIIKKMNDLIIVVKNM